MHAPLPSANQVLAKTERTIATLVIHTEFTRRTVVTHAIQAGRSSCAPRDPAGRFEQGRRRREQLVQDTREEVLKVVPDKVNVVYERYM